MDKKFIGQMKELLLEKKSQIEEELKKIADRNPEVSDTDYVTKFPQFGFDMEENADEVPLYEQNLAIEQHLEKNLRDIEDALSRIEKGNYGLCKYCGKEIDIRRLEARPASSTCMTCKTKILKR